MALTPEDQALPFFHHLHELRKRLFWSVLFYLICCGIAYYFYPSLIRFFVAPFLKLPGAKSQVLYINSIFEGFLLRFKLSFLFGIVMSMPIHVYNVFRFIFPALKKKERQVALGALLSSTLLVALSFYLAYYKLIPTMIEFMADTSFIPQEVGVLLNFENNIYYVLQMVLYALILFQFPVILQILLALNILKRKMLWKASRFVIVFIFILSAIFSPPDFVSQLFLSIPLTILYFMLLLIAKLLGWGDE